MFERARRKIGAAALAGALAAVCLLVPAGGGAAAPRCGQFQTQADAQDAFMAAAGSPSRNVGKMDPDGDGVACEALPGPFKGYATIGFHRKKQFFYGVVNLPQPPSAGEAVCMYGNTSFPDASRRLNIYRVGGDGDRALLSRKAGTAAYPERGRLLWKVERPQPVRARYYVAFEERIRLSPYGRNQCPGFSSHATLLPRPRR